jgi:hypothetical protein
MRVTNPKSHPPDTTSRSDINWASCGDVQPRYVAAATIATLVTILYFLLQPSALLIPVTDTVFVLASGTCTLLSLLVAYRWGFRGKFGLVHFGLFLGLFLWFLGDATWAIYETTLGVEVPYPSVGDAFYLAGYVPIAVGLLQFLWAFRAGFDRQRSLAALGISLLAVGLTYAFLIGPLLASSADVMTKTFDLAYPVLDSMLVALALFMSVAFRGGKMAGPWFWISIGLILTVLADITFSLGTLQGWYYSGHPIELIQLFGYIGLALGFDQQREEHMT